LTHGGGLDQNPLSCSGGQLEALFVINQISNAAVNAPKSITVFFSDGSSAVFPLFQLQNSNAHYQGVVPAGAKVTGAQAVIYSGWSGSFVLSHYLCGSTTPPTSTPPTSKPPTTVSPTTAPPTTKPPTTVSPTTAPPTTKGSSSTTEKLGAGSGTTTSTTVDADAATTTLAPATSSHAATASTPKLAFTGSNSANLAWLGLALIGVGLLLTAARRRGGPRGPGSDN
jgi:LPXTG-motif cell wall-anchored protein